MYLSRYFYFTAGKEALLLPGLGLLKVKLPLNLSGPVDLFASGVAQCPRNHMGVIWLSFLSFHLQVGGSFAQKVKGRHYLPALGRCWNDPAVLSEVPCFFCFASLPYKRAEEIALM